MLKLMSLAIFALFAVCAFGAPALYDLQPLRLVRSDPAVYDGYENSFYRGYGADLPYRFGNQQTSNW